MNNQFSRPLTLLHLIAAAWLAGCAGSPSPRFYTLTPMASPESTKTAREGTNRLLINVAPVEIPDYLDRPQIVTRSGRNEIKLAEFDRWAGAIGENISAVLAEDLALLLGADRVFVNAGATLEKADYSVMMRVLRLDCLPGDHVLLKAQWTVVPGTEPGKAVTHFSSITEEVGDRRYDTMVAAVNKTVELVGREIAGAIRRTRGETAP